MSKDVDNDVLAVCNNSDGTVPIEGNNHQVFQYIKVNLKVHSKV